MKPLRIAITGGRGRLSPFVGGHLSGDDVEVVSFSRTPGEGYASASLLSQPRTLASFDAVLHLGWSTVPLTSEERPGIEQTVDLPMLDQMLKACVSTERPPHFVFFSSAAAYGNTASPATEQTPCRPIGNYARAKLRAEEIIRSACDRHDALRACVLRISNVFGPAINATRPQGIIARVCRAIHEGAPISIWGDGSNTKDYLFIDDFLEAVKTVVDQGLRGTYNVASEQSLSVLEIVSLVESFAGKKLRITHGPAFSWDVEESRISAQKIRAATGWRAQHDITDAIRQVTEAELRCV